MRRRYLEPLIEELAFEDHKIALLSGARQCGKTTLAKRLLAARKSGAYHNWDQVELRRTWAKHPQSLIPAARGKAVPLLVLDEIHKARLWKRTLKGMYDTLERPVDTLVTGSARLAVYRRGSDSLLGRYRTFRLHPFSVAELTGRKPRVPDESLASILGASRASAAAQEALDSLTAFGPFPEPVLAQDARRARIWRRERVDAVVREDLRDLSRITELDRVQMLAALLPERVGSVLSVQALREDLEVAHETARRWLTALAELYYCFEVKPFTRGVRRSVRKEGKLYLWDPGEVPEAGPRFENLVACHLLKACHYWTDAGYGDFSLCYVRNRDGRELDFLIVRDGAAWLPVETKHADVAPAPAFRTFAHRLGCLTALQLIATPGVRAEHDLDGTRIVVMSAADALSRLV